jgi:hypothetical protein
MEHHPSHIIIEREVIFQWDVHPYSPKVLVALILANEDLKVNRILKAYDKQETGSFTVEEFCNIVKTEVFKHEENVYVKNIYGPFIDVLIRSLVEKVRTNEAGRIDQDGIM